MKTNHHQYITHSRKYQYPILILILITPLLCGLIWEDSWWGTHFISFTPNFIKFSIIVASITLLLFSFSKKIKDTTFLFKTKLSKKTSIGISLISCILFYNIQIAADFYGNARNFTDILDQTITTLPADFFKECFSYELTPGNGRRGVLLLVKYISYLFNISILNAFKLLDAFCGGIFVFTWLNAVQYFISKKPWQLIISIIGLSSPLLLIFFGHIETYAPIFVLLFNWLFIFTLYLKKKKTRHLLLLVSLLIIGIRLHNLMLLLLPTFLLGILYHQKNNYTFLTHLYSIKGIFQRIFAPIVLIGLVCYFFVFKDHNDPRRLDNFNDIDRLFLPLFSPDPPLDKYNLLSFNHFFDYFNMIYLWSPVLLFFFTYLLARKRKIINWNTPTISLMILTFFIFASFLFAMNPLFSMPMDWDLFMFPIPIALILLLLLTTQIQHHTISKKLLYSSIVFTLWCIPIFFVFFSKQASSHRIESTSVHIYKTYYEHSSTYMLYALNMDQQSTPEAYMKRKKALINKLAPYATLGNDKQYSELLIDEAINELQINNNLLNSRKYFLKSLDYYSIPKQFTHQLTSINHTLVKENHQFSKQDIDKSITITRKGITILNQDKRPKEALTLFNLANYYFPLSKENKLQTVVALFQLQNFTQAYHETSFLIKTDYPSREKALRMALHIALEAQLFDKALLHTETLIDEFGSDNLLSTIQQRIQQKDRMKELKYLFQRN